MFIPFARGRAATRAVLWAVPTFLLGAACILIYGRLSFSRTAVTNGIVDYAIAAAALPLAVLAAVCIVRSIKHLAAALWPAPLGVFGSADLLQLRLGPFGWRKYPSKELEIRYPFELMDESEEGGFERFLPEEEQQERLLPRIKHPAAKDPIHRVILRYAAGEESEIATMLRPAIVRWRSNLSASDSTPAPIPSP